ncbi:MAG: dihydrolipoyl dehydrogenase [Planctomycetaceae bacterium]|nr:dihydrolipoyl dehydrogenase [Planctomycetaceae bacterium]
MYDLLILGGGPAGYSAAIAAGRAGKRVAVFEGETVGGTCLNVGCIPTKYLLDKGSLLGRIRQLSGSGILRDPGQFSYSRIAKGKDAVVKKLTDGVATLLKNHRVELINGEAELSAPDTVRCCGKEYTSKNVLLATGSEPSQPPIPGIEATVNSTQLLALHAVPRRLVVIGAGVIGVELASAMKAFGSEVVVLEMMPELFPGEEREIVNLVARQITKSGITIHTNARVNRIEVCDGAKKVMWQKDGKEMITMADVVLAASGRKARLTGIDVKKLGLETNNGAITVNARMMTSIPGVYAAGDVVGGWQLAHSAYYEAECAVADMLGHGYDADERVMPRCIYTIPSFAAVGMTSQKAAAGGLQFRTGRFPFAASGMALAEDSPEGMALVISDEKTDTVLGAHLFGHAAHELISTATIAISSGIRVQQWEKIITPHPSLSEALQEAALASIGIARHII